jgi:hypothetical protein
MIKRNRKETDRKKYICEGLQWEGDDRSGVGFSYGGDLWERKKDRDEEEREKEKWQLN